MVYHNATVKRTFIPYLYSKQFLSHVLLSTFNGNIKYILSCFLLLQIKIEAHRDVEKHI
jgi:hypothetical protein